MISQVNDQFKRMALKEMNAVTKPATSEADINAERNIIHLIDPSTDFEKLTHSNIDKCEMLKKFM